MIFHPALKHGISITAFVISFSCLITACEKNVKQESTSKNSGTDTTFNKEKGLLTIIGVGDIMLGSNYPSSASLPPDDGKDLLTDVQEFLQDADITTGNLEGTLLNSGGTPKKCREKSEKSEIETGYIKENCHSFRMPERYAGYLKEAGFDYVNLANNHSGDMGEQGRESTYKTLDEYEIAYAGTLEYPTAKIEKDGIKYGFAGFAPNRGTCNINDLEKAKDIVKEIKLECDIVIVFFHGGAEGISAQHIPMRHEVFLGENRGDVYEFAHAVVDAGADIVFGSGPHVTRAVELYKDRFIAYSLGNFCTYGKFSLSGAMGIAPIIKVFVNKKGEFQKGEIIPVKQIKRGFTVKDESGSVINIIRQLTRSDIPSSKISINDDGLIEKK